MENFSGLFDKGVADGVRLSSVSSEDDLLTLDTTDLLSTLDKSALDLDFMSPVQCTDEDFMEVFTDLSELLGGVPGGVSTSAPGVGMENLLDMSDLFPDTEVTQSDSRKRPAPSNPDHLDYTCKRPRAATASTSEGPAEITSSASELPTSVDLLIAPPESPTTEGGPVPGGSRSKYIERRMKNNIASRRSRQTRKQKFIDMEVQADELELANEKLKKQVAELEKLTKVMKDMLVTKLAGR